EKGQGGKRRVHPEWEEVCFFQPSRGRLPAQTRRFPRAPEPLSYKDTRIGDKLRLFAYAVVEKTVAPPQLASFLRSFSKIDHGFDAAGFHHIFRGLNAEC